MKQKCACCGGERIISGVKVSDRGPNYVSHSLELETFRKPGAAIFKGRVSATVWAKVCEDCGHVMLFTAPDGVENLKRGRNLS